MICAPFYSTVIHDSVQSRRDQFVGLVYAPVVFHKLMDGTLEQNKRDVGIRIRDAGGTLYDEARERNDRSSLFKTARELNLYGRTWKFDIWTTESFNAANSSNQPIFILIGGIIIDALLLFLFIMLTRANRNAVRFVDLMTYDLQNKAIALQNSNAELEKFASISSHDLQEPLRKVQAFGDRLKGKYADRLPDEGQDYIERMQGAAARMQDLIDGVLEFSRIRKSDRPFELVDMEKVVRDVVSDMEIRIEETNAKVEFSALPTIDADPVQMRQLIQNLISNSLKYRKPDTPPVIQISADFLERENSVYRGAPTRMCRIQFKDNGIGFDSEYAERIFEIFQRLHGRTEYAGTGIGLAVAKSIVEHHGGAISAEGKSGEGATFTVTLPSSNAIWEQAA